MLIAPIRFIKFPPVLSLALLDDAGPPRHSWRSVFRLLESNHGSKSVYRCEPFPGRRSAGNSNRSRRDVSKSAMRRLSQARLSAQCTCIDVLYGTHSAFRYFFATKRFFEGRIFSTVQNGTDSIRRIGLCCLRKWRGKANRTLQPGLGPGASYLPRHFKVLRSRSVKFHGSLLHGKTDLAAVRGNFAEIKTRAGPVNLFGTPS